MVCGDSSIVNAGESGWKTAMKGICTLAPNWNSVYCNSNKFCLHKVLDRVETKETLHLCLCMNNNKRPAVQQDEVGSKSQRSVKTLNFPPSSYLFPLLESCRFLLIFFNGCSFFPILLSQNTVFPLYILVK